MEALQRDARPRGDANTRGLSNKGLRRKATMSHPLALLVWAYFFTLIFDGVLRKWMLPGFSNPLLLVREPIVLLAYLYLVTRNRFPLNNYSICAILLAFFAVSISVLTPAAHPLVVFYGLKSSFLHIPMIFVIALALTRRDVLRMGQVSLILVIGMFPLMALQFGSSPGSFWNFGPGAQPFSMMEGAMGKIRAAGYFSFITGAAQFLAFCSAFCVFGLLAPKAYPRWLIIGSGVAIVCCVAVSISRLALGSVALVLLSAGLAFVLNPRLGRGLAGGFMLASLIMLLAVNLDVFKEGTVVFSSRLDRTGDLDAGIVGTAGNWTERTFGDFTRGVNALGQAPLLGQGLGSGTNVAARLLTGSVGFTLAESEWPRVIHELGPILGLAFVSLRVGIVLLMLRVSVNAASKGDALPMLIFGASALLVVNGQWGQSTTLGFSILGAGLCLAAAKPIVRKRQVKPVGKTVNG